MTTQATQPTARYTTTGRPLPSAHCPACGYSRGRDVSVNGRTLTQVVECGGCGALHGTGYRGDLLQLVLLGTLDDGPMDEARAFDFTELSSQGVRRVHGFFNPATGRVLQYG